MRISSVLVYLSAVPFLVGAQPVTSPQEITSRRMAPLTVDVRSVGMGGLRASLVNGGSSVFSNPAAMAALDHTSIDLGGFIRTGLVKSEYEQESTDRENYSAWYLPTFTPSHAAIAAPIAVQYVNFGMALGVGYHARYDFNYTLRENFELSGAETQRTTKTRGILHFFSPSLAFKIGRVTHLGVAFNLGIPGWVSAEDDVSDPASITFTGAARAGVTLGILAAPVDPLKIGLTLVSPSTWELQEEDATGIKPIDIPFRVSLSTLYRITEQLSAGGEFQTRMFSNTTNQGEALEDGFSVRLGGEYVMEVLDIRFGGRVESYPLTDANIGLTGAGASSIQPNLSIGLSAGAGFKPTDALTIDGALSWNRIGRQDTHATTQATFAYSENFFRLDIGASLDLPGINMNRDETFQSDTTLPPPVEVEGR